MSVYSARKILPEVGREAGYCLPLALDSVMKHGELPMEFYDLFYDDFHSSNPSYNRTISLLLTEYFGVTPEPDTDKAAIAKFNAFGASPQRYMSDISKSAYEERLPRMLAKGVTEKQLRLQELFASASRNGCNILFSDFNAPREHAAGIQEIDPGMARFDMTYVIRNWVDIQNGRTYSTSDLAGIRQTLGSVGDNYAPLPERARSYFPEDQTSWELIILPPDPNE